jgi:hypothetical protein
MSASGFFARCDGYAEEKIIADRKEGDRVEWMATTTGGVKCRVSAFLIGAWFVSSRAWQRRRQDHR